MATKIYSNYGLRPTVTPEKKGNGKSLVDKAGYVPAKVRIEQMILAGQRLVQSRRDMYDAEKGETNIPLSVVRRRNVDYVDVANEAKEVTDRLKTAAKEAQAKKAVKDSPKAPEASSPASGEGKK